MPNALIQTPAYLKKMTDKKMEIQLEFLGKVNKILSDFNYQKELLTDENTNPHHNLLSIYVLGGWAINRYYDLRKTNDLDILCYNKSQELCLEYLQNNSVFSQVSSPNTSKIATKKITLERCADKNKFSLETRFFDEVEHNIKFGEFIISSEWLYLGSENFIERPLGVFPFIKVPSRFKLIVLKAISIISRNEADKSKLTNDIADIFYLYNSLKNPLYIDEILSYFRQVKFTNDQFDKFKNIFQLHKSDVERKLRVNLDDNSIFEMLFNSSITCHQITNITEKELIRNDMFNQNAPLINSVTRNAGALIDQNHITNQIVELIHWAEEEIHIYMNHSTGKVYFDFIMLLVSKLYDSKNRITVKLTYFDDKPDGKKQYYSRVRFFKQLGVKVRICKPVKPNHFFVGIITDYESNAPKLLTLKQAGIDLDDDNRFGEAVYMNEQQCQLIQYIYDSINMQYNINFDYIETEKSISIKEMSVSEYTLYLKNTKLYNDIDVDKFTFKLYNKSDLLNIYTKQKGVKSYKIKQHNYVSNKLNLPKCKISYIELLNNVKHVINIPILEIHNNKKYLIEGHSRLYQLHESNEDFEILVAEIKDLGTSGFKGIHFIDSSKYLNYKYKFENIKLDEKNDLIDKNSPEGLNGIRDVERYTHFEYYMRIRTENFNEIKTLFPLSFDN